MALSVNAVKRLIHALTSRTVGNEVASAIDSNTLLKAQSARTVAASIVATSVSATTDFAALLVGDQLVHIAATPGNAGFEVVVTAGTKPSAAVVGDLYIALRAAPAASASARSEKL